jgi:hypothetical protein
MTPQSRTETQVHEATRLNPSIKSAAYLCNQLHLVGEFGLNLLFDVRIALSKRRQFGRMTRARGGGRGTLGLGAERSLDRGLRKKDAKMSEMSMLIRLGSERPQTA